MIISFRLTERELLAGRKTVTRRRWATVTAARFKAGTTHEAWSNLPYVKGARRLGTITATQDAYLERLSAMPIADLEAEGGMVTTIEAFINLIGGKASEEVWVARFTFQADCL